MQYCHVCKSQTMSGPPVVKPDQDGGKNCFNARTEKPRAQYQIWKTGLVTLALHSAGNPSPVLDPFSCHATTGLREPKMGKSNKFLQRLHCTHVPFRYLFLQPPALYFGWFRDHPFQGPADARLFLASYFRCCLAFCPALHADLG